MYPWYQRAPWWSWDFSHISPDPPSPLTPPTDWCPSQCPRASPSWMWNPLWPFSSLSPLWVPLMKRRGDHLLQCSVCNLRCRSTDWLPSGNSRVAVSLVPTCSGLRRKLPHQDCWGTWKKKRKPYNVEMFVLRDINNWGRQLWWMPSMSLIILERAALASVVCLFMIMWFLAPVWKRAAMKKAACYTWQLHNLSEYTRDSLRAQVAGGEQEMLKESWHLSK